MTTHYVNGRPQTVIDDRPGELDLDGIEKAIRLMKSAQKSKLPVHLCHLEKLVSYAREYLNMPKFDNRRMG